MDIRNKVAKYSLISTIMHGITLLFFAGLLIMLVVLTFSLTGVIGDSIGLLEDVNPDDVTAGWRVLFGAAGGFFGVIAGIMFIAMAIFLIGPVIAQIVVLVYGIRTYKKRDTSEFKRMVKNDSIIKLVISAVIVVISLFLMPSSGSMKAFVSQLDEMACILVFDIPSIVTVVISVMVLRNIIYIQDL